MFVSYRDSYWINLKYEFSFSDWQTKWRWGDGSSYAWNNFDPDPPDTSGWKRCTVGLISQYTWGTTKCSDSTDALVLCQVVGGLAAGKKQLIILGCTLLSVSCCINCMTGQTMNMSYTCHAAQILSEEVCTVV